VASIGQGRIGFVWGHGFPFQRFSYVRHLAPTARQIEVG
jgi:hypothetical protein